MRAAGFLLFMTLALAGCQKPREKSLVGDFPVPGAYALAGDTITVWKRIRRPDGDWRFESYSITPGGTVEYLAEDEHGDAPLPPEEAPVLGQDRKGFALPKSEFAAIRAAAARLRPASLGPGDPVGGYGGEVLPAGCTLDKAQPRVAGVNFLNNANWGAFTLQPGCRGEAARAAAAVVTEMFDRLERAAAAAPQAQRQTGG